AEHVGPLEVRARPPDAGLGGRVEDDVLTAHRLGDRGAVRDVGAPRHDPAREQLGVVAAAEHADGGAFAEKPQRDRPSEKAAAARDQRLQRASRSRASAQRFSVKRWILALWRVSTGKRGWKSTARNGNTSAMRAAMPSSRAPSTTTTGSSA